MANPPALFRPLGRGESSPEQFRHFIPAALVQNSADHALSFGSVARGGGGANRSCDFDILAAATSRICLTPSSVLNSIRTPASTRSRSSSAGTRDLSSNELSAMACSRFRNDRHGPLTCRPMIQLSGTLAGPGVSLPARPALPCFCAPPPASRTAFPWTRRSRPRMA